MYLNNVFCYFQVRIADTYPGKVILENETLSHTTKVNLS
jgi:hypothetical protein